MATEKPQLISTSLRLRIEQHIFWFERIALFLLCTLSCSLSVTNSSLDQREENNLTSTRIVTAPIIILITMTNAVYVDCWKERTENINPNPNPESFCNWTAISPIINYVLGLCNGGFKVKTEAKAQAEKEERIAFWIERLAITFFFSLFFLFKKASTGAIWAMAGTASLFVGSNFTYLLLFLESEALYVQINNTFKALKETRDELRKLKTEYREQCTEYEKQCTEYEKKLEEEYNEAIEECKKYYQMKLKGARSYKEQCTEYKKKLEEVYNEAIELKSARNVIR